MVLEPPPAAEEAAPDPARADWDALEQAAAAETATAPARQQAVPTAAKLARQQTGRSSPAQVAEGESLSALNRRLGDRYAAAVQFARQQARRYSMDRAGGQCGCCGRAGTPPVYAISWRGHITEVRPSRWSFLTIVVGAVMFNRRSRGVEFTTFHGVCGRCFSIYRLLRGVGMLLVVAAVVLLLVGFVKGVLNLAELTDTKRPPPDAVGKLIVAILMMVAGAAAWWAARQLRVPWRLRSVGPWPFSRRKIVRSA